MTWTFVIVNITSRLTFVTTLIGLLHTSSKVSALMLTTGAKIFQYKNFNTIQILQKCFNTFQQRILT